MNHQDKHGEDKMVKVIFGLKKCQKFYDLWNATVDTCVA